MAPKLGASVGCLTVADVMFGAVADHLGLVRSPGGFLRRGPKHGVSPPPRRSIGDRKELTLLSNHTFVRSMVRTWCHSRHLIEELAPRTKANEYHNTKCKNSNNMLKIFLYFPC